ncbi:MAG: C40 family peptidase [Cyclobacteriaceae bacterium]
MPEAEKGICRMSLVPMRAEPSNDAEMCSQILFGEHYSVINSEDDWVELSLQFDSSTGWIRRDQHEVISSAYFDQINNSDYKVCTELAGDIYFRKKRVNILMGSILPISTNELFKLEEQVAFNGASKSLNQKREFEFFKEVLSKYMYTPYLPGGKTPFGIDEGGLVQQVFKICGYRLPRTMREQVSTGKAVESLKELNPGDLIYSGESEPNGAFIHLSDSKIIGVFDGQVQNVESNYLENNTAAIRRVLH